MRVLSEPFMNDLINEDGKLHSILERVKRDHTLMLAIRDDYINIYFRGGNILRISEKKKGSYQAEFDKKYNKTQLPLPTLPALLTSQSDVQTWLTAFGTLKNTMDQYFSMHPKNEREFQQLVVRENNNSSISNESEYFITDIELADSHLGARFDLMGLRWLASQRRITKRCKVFLMEMKYGDDALGGTAGLLKHLIDLEALITDRNAYQNLCMTIESQFQQLDQLKLLNFNHTTPAPVIRVNPNQKPEVIFLLANHNPRSKKLKNLLSDPAINAFAHSLDFDLRFSVSRFAGYALHANYMLTLDEFRKLV